MKIREVTLKCFEVPLVRPLMMGRQVLRSRQGLLLQLTDDSGCMGIGECSPLPGLHQETLEQADQQLQNLRWDVWEHQDLLPSVRNAIEMAIWDMTVARPPTSALSVCLNGLLVDEEDSPDTLLDQGYRSIKIKVGRQSLERDIQRVTEVKAALRGRATLRLDANRCWTLEQACRFGLAVEPDQIEYIEEPTQGSCDHATFAQETGIPVAWDESLVAMNELPGAVSAGVSAWVLKPAVLGGFHRTRALIALAKAQGLTVVLSSIFEMPRTLACYARLAHAHGLSDTPQGLDTWRWLDDDLDAHGMRVREGRLWV